MQVSDIYALCDEISPFCTQETWDNSGLNIGNLDNTFKHIVLCLEVNMDIAKNVPKNALIITHHPLLFSPLRTFQTALYPCNIAHLLLAKHCSLISLHTNFDKSHLNAYLAYNVLGFKDLVQNGLIINGTISPISLEQLANLVKKRLNAPFVRFVYGFNKRKNHTKRLMIEFISIVCGSGYSLLSQLEKNPRHCFITADIKHHDAMQAQSMDISLIDIGHYESEKYFVQIMESILQNAGYNAIIADCKNPFYLA